MGNRVRRGSYVKLILIFVILEIQSAVSGQIFDTVWFPLGGGEGAVGDERYQEHGEDYDTDACRHDDEDV
eukprot:1389026-Amorphochlora_amoeboformis.AAC.3